MINDTVCAGVVDACVRSRIASAADNRIPVSMLSDKRSKPVEPEPLTRPDAPALTVTTSQIIRIGDDTTQNGRTRNTADGFDPTLVWSRTQGRREDDVAIAALGQ